MPILPVPLRSPSPAVAGMIDSTQRSIYRRSKHNKRCRIARRMQRAKSGVWEDAMYESLGLYIGGEWRAGADGRHIDVIDPASERPLGRVPAAGPRDVEAAIAAAEKAWRPWSRTPAWERAKIIRRIGDLDRKSVV